MEKQRRDRVRIVVILLLIINLLATGAVAYGIADMWNAKQATEKKLGTMQVLYIGTNDKDTKQREIPLPAAKEKVKDICLRYVDGVTILDAEGIWADEAGVKVSEGTIVCCFLGAKEEVIQQIITDVRRELNQDSVLEETRRVQYSFVGE
jgi:hypothetical protein